MAIRDDSPAPHDRRTRVDETVAAIRADIVNNVLLPGQSLRQEELARRYAVSRIPLREALRRLQAEGLVVLRPFRGAVVSELTDDEARELVELRLLLMRHALRLAVPLLTEDDLARAQSALEAARDATDLATWGARIDAFYLALCAPAGRPRLLAMLRDMQNQSQRYRARIFADPALRAHFRAGTQRLLEFCRERDAEGATREVEGYMREALDRYMNQLASRGGPG